MHDVDDDLDHDHLPRVERGGFVISRELAEAHHRLMRTLATLDARSEDVELPDPGSACETLSVLDRPGEAEVDARQSAQDRLPGGSI